MAKHQKAAKKNSALQPSTEAADEKRERAKKIALSRRAAFTIDELRMFRDLLAGFVSSMDGKLAAMEKDGLTQLDSVLGATQPVRVEREMRSFLGNIGQAIERQRPMGKS